MTEQPAQPTPPNVPVAGYGQVTPPAKHGPGVGAYVASLLAGVPVALLMAFFALDSVLVGEIPGVLTLLMVASSTAGSVFAVVGMRSRPRRFKKTALLLTLPSAFVFVAGVGFLILLLVALIAGGTA